jgi:hypothetical protein
MHYNIGHNRPWIWSQMEGRSKLSSGKDFCVYIFIYLYLYRVFRAHADWTLTLHSTVSSENPKPLAEKNAAARPELLAHIVYVFR